MKRYEYENKYYNLGYDYIIGLDEAGRGPMAGELVVAGVIFPKGYYDERINDSKQLSAKKREVLYDLIIENALYYDIEIISVADVDRLNVYQASKQGMEKCLELLKKEKMFALTDAMPIDYPDHLSIIKGDAKSISIAGASILAKVTRDRLMDMLRKHIKKLWENMEFVQFIVNLLDRSKRYYQNRCHLIFNDIF